jgi:Flp pilus assembly protein TadB
MFDKAIGYIVAAAALIGVLWAALRNAKQEGKKEAQAQQQVKQQAHNLDALKEANQREQTIDHLSDSERINRL